MPPVGQNVVVVLDDGTEVLAYWMDGVWWVGQENDPEDIPVNQGVQSWHWPEA